jgi:hypothetical protein
MTELEYDMVLWDLHSHIRARAAEETKAVAKLAERKRYEHELRHWLRNVWRLRNCTEAGRRYQREGFGLALRELLLAERFLTEHGVLLPCATLFF